MFWSSAAYIFIALGHWDKKSSLNKDLDNNWETVITETKRL